MVDSMASNVGLDSGAALFPVHKGGFCLSRLPSFLDWMISFNC